MAILYTLGAVVLAYCAFNIFKMCTVKLYGGKFTEILPMEVPATHLDNLISVEKQLIKLGFKLECHVFRSKVMEGQEWGAYGVVYYSHAMQNYALAIVEPVIHAALDYRLYFCTFDDRGNLYETLSGSDFPARCYPKSIHINDAMTLCSQEQWGSHQAFLKENSIIPSDVKLARSAILELCERVFFSGLVESGAISNQGDFYRSSITAAFGVFYQSHQVQFKLGALKQKSLELVGAEKCHGAETGKRQLEAYQTFKKVQEKNKLGAYGNTILLLISVALFAASFGFGFGFSLQTLAILVVVLAIHELGHLFGMWMFGYRDLKMFFVPFLGALAIGKKEDIRPWQEAIVLVSGPLPGYVLGLAILFSDLPDMPLWVINYAVFSVILSALNLLPFMPLDGGRLVNIGLFNKAPVLQLVFYVVSIVCFVMVGIFLEDKVGFVVAILLAIGLPNLRREVVFLRILLKEKVHKKSFALINVLQVLSRDALWMRLSAQNRWAILDSLSYRVQHAKANAATASAIMCLWFCSLVVPLYLMVNEEDLLNASITLSSRMEEEAAVQQLESLEKQYAESISHADKLGSLRLLVAQAAYQNHVLADKYWEVLIDLSNSIKLSTNEREAAYSDIAGLCYLFEEEGCSFEYYRKLVSLADASDVISVDRIDALLNLADDENSIDAVRLEYLQRASVDLGKGKDEIRDPSLYLRISKSLFNLGEFDLSIEFARSAIAISDQYSNSLSDHYVLNLVNIYSMLGRTENAITLIDSWGAESQRVSAEGHSLSTSMP
jgi:tetratricopeptide (TPR) repeat protein